jgi:CRP/FNR family transcriptional regulator, polysaccharide utilization system transcription regulator
MKHILLIEDNKDVRENTAEILELAGYRMSTAENGKEGVAAAQQLLPDLIICDIMMPVLDGYGVLHMLSKNLETSLIPFIFLTAKSERGAMRKGMEMGADDYITKPFEEIELLNAIESRLRKSEQARKAPLPGHEGVNQLLSGIQGMEDISKVSERYQFRHFRKKDLIYTEGDTAAGLYLLQTGKVKTYRSHELGKDLITRLLQPGDFFGYLALLEESQQGESAEALEDAEVVVFPKEDFFKLIYQSPAVTQQFIKLLSGNLAEEQDKLLALAYSSVRKRTARALLELRSRYSKPDEGVFKMAVARDDLASMVGTATESLIRTLSDFRAEGIIGITGSIISVENVEKLERMKN